MHYNITTGQVYSSMPISVFVPPLPYTPDPIMVRTRELFKEEVGRDLMDMYMTIFYGIDNFYSVEQIREQVTALFYDHVNDEISNIWQTLDDEFYQDVVSGEFTPEELKISAYKVYSEDCNIFSKYYHELAREVDSLIFYPVMNMIVLMHFNGFKLYPRVVKETPSGMILVADILSIEEGHYYANSSYINNPNVVYRETGRITTFI